MQPSDRLIFALDVDNAAEALELVRLLKDQVGVFKLGLELFIAEGPGMVQRLRDAGAQALFLDLKLHDIPATMRAAARAAARLGVDLLTCHADQPGIFTDLELGHTRLLGVTVLTSLGPDELRGMGYPPELQEPSALVQRRARLALAAGCHGVVCSGWEAAAMRAALGPAALVVCPGIRLPGDDTQDQKRIMTPRRALEAGASHIVVGRPIRTAPDPVAAAQRILSDLAR